MTCPFPSSRDSLKNIRISKVNTKACNIAVVDPEIEGEIIIPGQAGNRHASGGTVGQSHRLAECSTVHVVGGAVLGVEGAVEAGTVRVITVEMLEAQGVRVVCDQLVIRHVIPHVQSGDLSRCQIGAVAAVFELVVIDVGHIAVLFVMIDGVVIGVVDCHESRRILHVYQIILVRAVVYGDIVPAVVLVIVQIVLGIIVLGERVVIIVVGRIIVIPRLEIRAVGVLIGNVVRGVLVQKVGQLDISLIVVGVIGRIMDRVKGPVIAVDDLGVGRVSAPVVVGHVARLVHHAAGRGRIILLRLVGRKQGIQITDRSPAAQRLRAVAGKPL